MAVVLWIMAGAVGLVGCSSTNKPSGSGGSGVAGAGSGGMTGVGGSSDGIGGMVGAGGSDGGTARRCHTNADCNVSDSDAAGAISQYATCFIQAAITDCTTAPEGICVSARGGNCGTHPDLCDCLLSMPGTPHPSCATLPGTICNEFPEHVGTECWGCFIVPDAGSEAH